MLPREIETEHGPERSRFDLPMRDLGPLRFIGVVPMLFAVGFAWMPAKEMVRMRLRNIANGGGGFEWIFVAFLSIFVLAALMPFGFGLFILAGRTRIIVAKDKLIMTELAGPLRWSRKVAFADVERLEIGGATTADGRTPGLLGALCGVTVTLKNGKKTPVVVGYPRAWLQPLVAEISGLMERRGKAVPVAEAVLKPESAGQTIETEQRVQKPAGSTIELTATEWSARFKVPSRGLLKDSYGLVTFGVIWTLAVGIFLVARGAHGDWLLGFGLYSVFLALGVGMLLLGIHLGTRRWTLSADPSQLKVTLKSAWRTREWRWAAGEIGDIRIGDSGTKVNERMLEQLQIHPRNGGRKTGLLTDRSHEELAWIATTLRGMLRVQASESPEAPPRIDRSRGSG